MTRGAGDEPLEWRLARWWISRAVPEPRLAEVLGDLREDFDRERLRRRPLFAAWWLVREAANVASTFRHADAAAGPDRLTAQQTLALAAREARLAVRALRRAPLFALASAATLAVGLGATTAVVSVADRALLRPLPYPNADRLTFMAETRRGDEISVSYPDFLDWQRDAHAFEALAVFVGTSFTLPGDGGAERVRAQYVGEDLFRILGSAPALGRAFTPGDHAPGSPRVVMIGDGLWRRRFGADASVLTQRLDLDGQSYAIVGVLPAGFDFPSGIVYTPAEIYLPMGVFVAAYPADVAQRDSHPGLEAVGLRRAGVTLASARAEMNGIAAGLGARYPAENRNIGVIVRDGVSALVGDLRDQIRVVAAAAGLVLLIACANVAGLTLTRSAGRAREFAVQAALGAPRWQPMTAIVAETTVVAIAGGIAGTLLGATLLRLIAPAVADLPRLDTVALDWRIGAIVFGVTALVAMASGVVPAMWIERRGLEGWIRRGGRGTSASRSRGLLVAGEIALALVLLLSAASLTTALRRMARDEGGVRPDGVLTFDARLPGDTPDARSSQFFDTLIERLRGLPGVSAVGTISVLPMSGGGAQTAIQRIGESPANGIRTDVNAVGADYFRAMDIRVVRGRTFTPQDTAASPQVAVIDEWFADRMWPGRDPVGQHVQGWGSHDLEIVGVVGHVKNYGPASPSREELYVPSAQRPRSRMYVVIRAAVEPGAIATDVRRALNAVDPSVAFAGVHTMRQLVDGTTSGTRAASLVSVSFAGTAGVLSLIGLTGLVAYVVQLKRREIGVRLALGATTTRVVREVMSRATRLTLIGVAIGLPAGLGTLSVLRATVAGIEDTGPWIIAAVPAAFLVLALLATWAPASAASRVAPTITLRDD